MTLTPAEIDALVGALVVLANAVANYLAKRSSSKRHAKTDAKLDALHRAVTAPPSVGSGNVRPNDGSATLRDGHALPPTRP